MSDLVRVGRKKKHQPKGSHKGRQMTHNSDTGKYRKAFIRCVKRTGKWRGKLKTVLDAY